MHGYSLYLFVFISAQFCVMPSDLKLGIVFTCTKMPVHIPSFIFFLFSSNINKNCDMFTFGTLHVNGIVIVSIKLSFSLI